MSSKIVATIKVAGKKIETVYKNDNESKSVVKLSIDQKSDTCPYVTVYHNFINDLEQNLLTTSIMESSNTFRQYRVQSIKEPHLCQCYHDEGTFGNEYNTHDTVQNKVGYK